MRLPVGRRKLKRGEQIHKTGDAEDKSTAHQPRLADRAECEAEQAAAAGEEKRQWRGQGGTHERPLRVPLPPV
jgi:hypothetical protein